MTAVLAALHPRRDAGEWWQQTAGIKPDRHAPRNIEMREALFSMR
jgi:hypothetical protein